MSDPSDRDQPHPDQPDPEQPQPDQRRGLARRDRPRAEAELDRDPPGASPADGAPDAAADEPGVPWTQQLGRATVVVLAVLFGVFAVANSQRVDFSWVFGETLVRDDPAGEGQIGGVPLIVLLLASSLIGAAIGALLEWQMLRRRRRPRQR